MAKNKEYSIKDLQLCFLKHYDSDTYFENGNPIMEDVFSDGLVAICEKSCDHFKQVSTGDIYFLYDTCPTVGDFFVTSCKPMINLIKPEKLLDALNRKFTKEEVSAMENVYIERLARERLVLARRKEEPRFRAEIEREIEESTKRILSMSEEQQAEELKKYPEIKTSTTNPSYFQPGWDKIPEIDNLFKILQENRIKRAQEELLGQTPKDKKDAKDDNGQDF